MSSTKKVQERNSEKIQMLEGRYEKLRAQLSQTGLIQVGSIARRMDRRRSASVAGGWVERGPYNQWTWKEKGKTRTRNLSAAQARAWSMAIENKRKLEAILLEMREVSLNPKFQRKMQCNPFLFKDAHVFHLRFYWAQTSHGLSPSSSKTCF